MMTFAAKSVEPAHSPTQSSAAPRRAPGIRNILRAPSLQAKLTVGAANDPAEHEADRIAEQVMRMPDRDIAAGDAGMPPSVFSAAALGAQRQCSSCEEEAQRKESGMGLEGGVAAPQAETALAALGDGAPLPDAERAFFEPRFGRSFESVRVHTGAAATAAARAVSARAFTLGGDIVFAGGEYSPGSADGRRLLAHELTHTIQQGDGRPS